MIKKLLTIVGILLISSVVYATSYYVDCSDSGSSNLGTYAEPFNSISTVNGTSFSTGDDVYFKVNTTCTPSVKLTIDWGGSSSNQTIIGAYYGEGQFGLNGNSRPIINGQNTVPSSDESPMIGSNGLSYITVKDLKITNSAGYGIQMQNADYGTVENCYTDHTYRYGIGFTKMSNSTISDNIVNDTYYWTSNGDAIDVTAGNTAGASQYNTVIRNVVSNANEGIGIYKKNDYTTVSYNVLYDNSSYNIYVDASKYTTINYNMIYTSTVGESNKGRGICVDNENARGYCYLDDVKIYGNLVANTEQGVFISNNYGYNTDTSCNTTNVLVYNNTLVDNDYNIRIVYDDAGWTGNVVKNNISWTITGGAVHVSQCSPDGVTFGYNLWDDDPGTGNCDAVTDPPNVDPTLEKTSGWRSLTAGSLDGTEFSIQSGSEGIGDAQLITGYNYRIYSSDFTASPISVLVSLQGDPDIGAWQYDGGGSQPVVSISATDSTATEENYTTDTGTYRITCSGQACAGETINIEISGGAQVNNDYDLSPVSVESGTISFSGSTQDITLSVIDDLLVEDSENATLTITSGTGYSVGTPASATVTIYSDDIGPLTGIDIYPNASGNITLTPGGGGGIDITKLIDELSSP